MVVLYCLKKDGQAFSDEFETAEDALAFGDRYWSNATEETRRGIRQYAVVEVAEEPGASGCQAFPCVLKAWKAEAAE